MAVPSNEKMDFGLPDWRDEDAYPDENAPIAHWRWQFIRRREDYREDWQKYKGDTYKYYAELHGSARDVLTPDHPEFMCRIPNSKDKYGLDRCPNPALDKPTRLGAPAPNDMDFLEHNMGTFVTVVQDKWRQEMMPIDAYCTLVAFDLRRPIPEQMENAKKVLEYAKDYMGRKFGNVSEVPRRRHIQKWRTYLRVLDARADGQTWRVIANEILRVTRQEEAAARQTWDAAVEIMNNFPR